MSMIESRLFQGGRLLRSNELFAMADESRCKQSGKLVDRIDPYQEADQPLAAPVGLLRRLLVWCELLRFGDLGRGGRADPLERAEALRRKTPVRICIGPWFQGRKQTAVLHRSRPGIFPLRIPVVPIRGPFQWHRNSDIEFQALVDRKTCCE